MNEAIMTVARQFYEALNEPTVDPVMEHFSDDAIYEDPLGGRHTGKAAVRAALQPSFSGTQRYTLDSIASDDDTIIATWSLEVGAEGARLRLEGVDILRFEGRSIRHKQCYMKATGLLMTPVSS